ncbi:hypothetical protein EOT10_31305 [Streptomyces antnestii]|uniref:Uncharacterized protein n=1 Tax=Streptomyces antnestii TaxID=2494256 RepID=A0A437P9M2_9ACTN|nr:hypothetical protein [Streptomyces sp. San01]RVU18990.1 hypothetical protein EOT10_31305 [Streptomyces sp. San01]
MTPHSDGNDHLPVYDSLVRERGDVVAETRSVAERALYDAAHALSGHGVVRPAPDQAAQLRAPADRSTTRG